jgi:hypothetical protein
MTGLLSVSIPASHRRQLHHHLQSESDRRLISMVSTSLTCPVSSAHLSVSYQFPTGFSGYLIGIHFGEIVMILVETRSEIGRRPVA